MHRAEADAERDDAGHDAADPAALGGGHELLHQRQVHAIEPADADADEEAHDGEIDPAIVRREIEQAGGDREVQHGADEDLAAADAVGEPAPDIGADDGADAGTHQHDGRLAEGELPRPDQEGEHEADQEVVEEFQRVADDGGGEDLDLVAGQTRASIEYLEHGVFPLAHVRFLSGRRACAPPMPGKLPCRRGERQARGTRGTCAQMQRGKRRRNGRESRRLSIAGRLRRAEHRACDCVCSLRMRRIAAGRG